MGAVKITKIGNSQGVTLPKEFLDKNGLELGDKLEVHFINGRIVMFKSLPHHSEMVFEGEQDQDEIEWADADLGEWDND